MNRLRSDGKLILNSILNSSKLYILKILETDKMVTQGVNTRNNNKKGEKGETDSIKYPSSLELVTIGQLL